jgi:hypothetical protein
MQFFAAALDCHLAITAYELHLRGSSAERGVEANAPFMWGSVFLVCVIFTMPWLYLAANNRSPGSINGMGRSRLHSISCKAGVPRLACSVAAAI